MGARFSRSNPFKGLNMRFVVHGADSRGNQMYNGRDLGRALTVQSMYPGSRLRGFEGGYTPSGRINGAGSIPGPSGGYGITRRTPKL